jgi:two-component SAPR family response regulator
MIAIAVDDEPLMLGALTKAIKASADITSVSDFTSCEDALDFVKNTPADIAFLDINMRGMGGLSLAEKIVGYCPDCKIVFCTGYEEYAIPAFKLHASGYLMKPVSGKDVQVEIDNIKGIRQKQKPLVENVSAISRFMQREKSLHSSVQKPKSCLPFWWIETVQVLRLQK